MKVQTIKNFVKQINETPDRKLGVKAITAMLSDIIEDYERGIGRYNPKLITAGDIVLVDIGPCKHYALIIHSDENGCLALPITTSKDLPYTIPFFSRILRVLDEDENEVQQYISLLPLAMTQKIAMRRFVGVLDDLHDIINTVKESNIVLGEIYNEILSTNCDEQNQ